MYALSFGIVALKCTLCPLIILILPFVAISNFVFIFSIPLSFATWLHDAILPSALYLIINTTSSILLYEVGVSFSCIVYFIVLPLNDVLNVSIDVITTPFVSVIISVTVLFPELISVFVISKDTPAIAEFVVLSYLYIPIFISCIDISLAFINLLESKLLITSFPFIIL